MSPFDDPAAQAPQSASAALMALTEELAPYFEAAKGVRAQLEQDGWSTSEAEAAAGEYMRGVIRLVFAQGVKAIGGPLA